MNDLTLLERLRLCEQGRLTHAEAAALERELDADPALRALAQDFALAYSATALDPWALGESRTSFEDLEARRPRRFTPRRAAAAAVLLLAAGGAFVAGRLSAPGDAPLYLSEIELDAPLFEGAAPLDLPADWADFDPRGPHGVHFLSDVRAAEELARVAHRPLLVYGTYPGCPMAAALNERVFSSRAVVELVERTVPVHIDLAKLSEVEQRSLTARGYPFLEMWRDDGSTTYVLARSPDAATFVESLHDGLARSDATGEQPSWDTVRALARRFIEARASELTGDLAAAERGFRALAADPGTPPEIGMRAAVGLRRLAEGARELLFAARATAVQSVDDARRLLERSLQAYAGTSYEPDLRATLARLERDGRFPPLAEMDRSS